MAVYKDVEQIKDFLKISCKNEVLLKQMCDIIDGFSIADVVEVEHGRWEEYLSDEDDYKHHRCSVCKEDAFFEYEYEPEYDEGYDGEWHYVSDEIRDMHEYLSPYCPNCGVKMKEDN